MTASEKQELKQLLDVYRDDVAYNDSEIVALTELSFANTSTHVPVAVKPRGTPFSLCSEVDQQIKNMEQRGIIKPSNSPYSAPILLVPKADGSYRFCADFRALILFMAPIFSLLLTCTVQIAKGHRHKTAFSTESGHWQFCVMLMLKMPQLSLHILWQIL